MNHSHNPAGVDTVKNPADRKLCLDVIRRLDRWIPRWPHYGSAMIQKDDNRGFRVSFYEIPERETKGDIATMISHMDPFINFSITRRATVYAITYGP